MDYFQVESGDKQIWAAGTDGSGEKIDTLGKPLTFRKPLHKAELL